MKNWLVTELDNLIHYITEKYYCNAKEAEDLIANKYYGDFEDDDDFLRHYWIETFNSKFFLSRDQQNKILKEHDKFQGHYFRISCESCDRCHFKTR